MNAKGGIVRVVADAAGGVGDAAAGAGKAIGGAVGAAGKGVSAAAGAVADAVGKAGAAAAGVMPGGENSPITEDQVMELLDVCYRRAVEGIPHMSDPVEDLVADYVSRYDDVADAARAMTNMQLVKNAASGFLSGAAGFFALPVLIAAIPANIANVLYVQLRMVVALAKMGGYDIRSDQVQTMVYACIAGSAATDILKDAGIKVAGKLAEGAIKQIPRATLTKINQAVGFRLITKFGETGAINLGKMIPIVGGMVGGSFDFATTKVIANVAYGCFIGESKGDVVGEDTVEVMQSELACEQRALAAEQGPEGDEA